MKTIFDLFMRRGFSCTLCGAFRERESEMTKHIRTFHGDRAVAQALKEATEDQRQ